MELEVDILGMKKIFFIITLSVLLALIFLPNLIKAQEELSALKDKIKGIVDFVKDDIVPYVGGFAIVVAGILFMFSGASPQLHNQAKDALIYIVVGLIIIWGASEIVKAIIGKAVCP